MRETGLPNPGGFQGAGGSAGTVAYGGPLQNRAYRYCQAFSTLEMLETALKWASKAPKEAWDFLRKGLGRYAKDKAKDIAKEAAKEAKKQFEAWAKDQQVMKFERRTEGTQCYCKGVVVFIPSIDEYRGFIYGKVGKNVSAWGGTDCCEPETFRYKFSGSVGRDDHGFIDREKSRFRTRGKLP